MDIMETKPLGDVATPLRAEHLREVWGIDPDGWVAWVGLGEELRASYRADLLPVDRTEAGERFVTDAPPRLA